MENNENRSLVKVEEAQHEVLRTPQDAIWEAIGANLGTGGDAALAASGITLGNGGFGGRDVTGEFNCRNSRG